MVAVAIFSNSRIKNADLIKTEFEQKQKYTNTSFFLKKNNISIPKSLRLNVLKRKAS